MTLTRIYLLLLISEFLKSRFDFMKFNVLLSMLVNIVSDYFFKKIVISEKCLFHDQSVTIHQYLVISYFYPQFTKVIDNIVFISGKTFCQSCKKKCSGEVLRVQDKYFHIACFKCAQCNSSLAQGGFFAREGSYYCTKVIIKKYK